MKMYTAGIVTNTVVAVPWKDLILQTPLLVVFHITIINYFIVK